MTGGEYRLNRLLILIAGRCDVAGLGRLTTTRYRCSGTWRRRVM